MGILQGQHKPQFQQTVISMSAHISSAGHSINTVIENGGESETIWFVNLCDLSPMTTSLTQPCYHSKHLLMEAT